MSAVHDNISWISVHLEGRGFLTPQNYMQLELTWDRHDRMTGQLSELVYTLGKFVGPN